MAHDETHADFVARVVAFERRLQANMDQIMCPVHLSLGHEKVAADIRDHIRPEDWLFSTHRNHHHYLAKGGDERKLWDEIMGLETGLNGGFAGSQSISDPGINFHSSAIVGGLVGVAIGVAMALQRSGSGVAVCCVGDAATEQGVFWESLNFAALHSLPIAFIIENNGMSVDSPLHERQAFPISQRVEAFGVRRAVSVRDSIDLARKRSPAFYEARLVLRCDHLNMSTLMPSLGLS